MTPSSTQRDILIDTLRVIASVSVIIIHTTDELVMDAGYQGGVGWTLLLVANIACRYAVPLYIILSGSLLLRTQQTAIGTTRRLRRILPLLLWIPIYYLVSLWLTPWRQDVSLGHLLDQIAHGDYIHLYFILIIIWLYVLTPHYTRHLDRIACVPLWGYILAQTLMWLTIMLADYAGIYGAVHTLITLGLIYSPLYLAGSRISTISGRYVMLGVGALALVVSARLTLGDSILIRYLMHHGSPLMMLTALACVGIGSRCIVHLPQLSRLARYAPYTMGVYVIHPLVILMYTEVFHITAKSITTQIGLWYGLKIVLVVWTSYALVYLWHHMRVWSMISRGSLSTGTSVR